MENCTTCLEKSFPCCDDFIVTTGLSAGHYYAWLKDRHGHIFTQGVNIAANGLATLDIDLFFTYAYRAVNFNQFSGKYELSFSTSGETNTEETLEVEGVSYSCILISFFSKN